MSRYSILMPKMNKCYVCGTTQDLHIHEVFYGTANRKKSIEYGCCVSLCAYHHNMSNEGVHYNKKLNEQLKQEMQRKFEEVYPDKDFRQIFGRNYL